MQLSQVILQVTKEYRTKIDSLEKRNETLEEQLENEVNDERVVRTEIEEQLMRSLKTMVATERVVEEAKCSALTTELEAYKENSHNLLLQQTSYQNNKHHNSQNERFVLKPRDVNVDPIEQSSELHQNQIEDEPFENDNESWTQVQNQYVQSFNTMVATERAIADNFEGRARNLQRPFAWKMTSFESQTIKLLH